MANENLTVFQRLQRVLSNGSTQKNYMSNNYNIVSPNTNSDIIATANSREDYEKKLLQAKQQALLGKQWIKANYDITNQSLAGLNDVRLMYRDADLMDAFPEIGAALDIVSEESTFINENGTMVNISSRSDRVKNILEDLFVNRLSIHTMLPMICRSMCKYGNTFMLLNIDSKNGVLGWKQLPVYEMERWENGQNTPYATPMTNLTTVDENAPQDTKFAWIGQNDYIPYRNWQIAHFRLLYDSMFLPYGCLVGDTRIETEYGYKEMSKIQIGDKVWTFNTDTQKRELGSVTMFMPKGEKDVYKVSTFHNEIEGTNDHKLLTYNDNKLQYKEIKDLKVGDLLIIDNSFNKCNKKIKIDKSYPTEKEANLNKNMVWWEHFIKYIPDYVDEDFAKFFGFMIGDGWITQNKYVYFATGEYEKFNLDFAKYINKITNHKFKFIRPYNSENNNYEYSSCVVASKCLSLIMHRMGFIDGFDKKRVPEWVFASNDEIKKAFLNGLMIADGSYNIDKYGILRCGLEMSNEQLVKDIKTLVQSLGYKSSKVSNRNRIGKTSQLKNGYNIISKNTSYYFFFYESLNTQEKKYDLTNRLENGFKTEKIRKIEYNGKKQTYDFTVDNKNSNFYANGIVTHNCSYLNKARRHFRMLSMMEDMMLIYRLDRSIERRVFKINVGAIDEADVQAYVQEIANNFKRKPIVDPLTGQIDLRKSFMNVTEDFFIPTRDDNAANPIETLQGAQNLTAMDDIKFVQNKVLTALRVPKSFLNFEETTGDGKNLSLLDVRFTRTVNRIQQSLLMELNKIAIIHLYLNGFQDDLNNFTLTMNNPSSQAEMLELENLAKKITTAKDAVSDPGGGMPLTSMMWAWKHIFKWSDKEIKKNLEELRLETALSAELQKTMQIIKKTGLFDSVDNIYGEPGAEYTDDNGAEGNDMEGGPSGGGGMPMGGGMDFGDEPSSGDMDTGAEGEMDMDMAAEENGIGNESGNENSGGNEMLDNGNATIPNLSDSLLREMSKKVLHERQRIKSNLLTRSKHYAEILEDRLVKGVNNEKKNVEKVDIYDKAFFLNEEMNSLKKQLEKIDTNLSSNNE